MYENCRDGFLDDGPGCYVRSFFLDFGPVIYILAAILAAVIIAKAIRTRGKTPNVFAEPGAEASGEEPTIQVPGNRRLLYVVFGVVALAMLIFWLANL